MPFIAHRVFNWRPVEIDASWGLNTIKPGHAYSICNSLQCRQCGHLFLDIRFNDDEMGNLYKDYRGETYTELRELYEPGYRMRNKQLNDGIDYRPQVEAWLRPHIGTPATVLDWGGDTGNNTPFVGEAGLVHIFDISNKATLPGTLRVSREDVALHSYDLMTFDISMPVTWLVTSKEKGLRDARIERGLLYALYPDRIVIAPAGK